MAVNMQQQQLLVQMNQILLDGLRSLNEKLSTSAQEHPEIASTATATASVEPEKSIVSAAAAAAAAAPESRKRKTGPKSDSSWICFVKDRSQSLKLSPGEKLMTVLAAEWKNMTDDQKEPFVAAAVASKAAKTAAIVDAKL